MSEPIFDNGSHTVFVYTDLVEGSGLQSNQVVIIHQDRALIIDPGGELTYTPLSVMLSRHITMDHLDYILASHQDPDIIASLPRWLTHTDAKIVVSKLWRQFLPHLASSFSQQKSGDVMARIQPLSDSGGVIQFNGCNILALPAHFMHSAGNFSFYDPISKVLFSGDIGSSFGCDANDSIVDFELHIEHMKGFHQRYIASNKACRYWVTNMRTLDIEMIVPQHGARIESKEHITRFLGWLEELPCGLDLIDQQFYQMNV